MSMHSFISQKSDGKGFFKEAISKSFLKRKRIQAPQPSSFSAEYLVTDPQILLYRNVYRSILYGSKKKNKVSTSREWENITSAQNEYKVRTHEQIYI